MRLRTMVYRALANDGGRPVSLHREFLFNIEFLFKLGFVDIVGQEPGGHSDVNNSVFDNFLLSDPSSLFTGVTVDVGSGQ